MAGSGDERSDVIRRFLDLSEADRLRAFAELRDYLSDELGQETDQDRAITRRSDALDALRATAAWLAERGALKADGAPTVKQHNEAVKELDLGWPSSRVIRAFGSWRNARRALLGGKPVESGSQRRTRARSVGRIDRGVEPVAALREWLETDPAGTATPDYDAFVEDRTRRSGAGAAKLPKADAVKTRLQLDWGRCLAVARRSVTLEEAKRDYASQLLDAREEDDLIGIGAIAALLGVRHQQAVALVRKDGFPAPVTMISGSRAWRLGDIRSHLAGTRATATRHLPRPAIDAGELARRLDLHPDYLRKLLSEERWDLVPRPDGRVGNAHYWWENSVTDHLNGARGS